MDRPPKKTPSQLVQEADSAVAIDLNGRQGGAMFHGVCYGMMGAIYIALAVYHFMES